MGTASGSSAKAASHSKTKGAASKHDALAKLKDDHGVVKKLFDQYEKKKDEMSDADKQAMVGEICMELKVHTQIEEEIFYPAVREVADEDLVELLDEAEVEHKGAKDLVAELEAGSPGDDQYDAKVTVLGEQVEHHADEEEDDMFPKVKKTELDLEQLGAELEARAGELKAARPTKK